MDEDRSNQLLRALSVPVIVLAFFHVRWKATHMLRKTLPLLSIMLIAALLAGGCTETGKTDGAVEGAGTVSRIENGGETYIIVTEDGTRYAPVNLDEDYRNDGMKVYFRGVILTDAETPGSPGIPVEIRKIGTYVPPGKNVTIVLEKT